LPVTVHRPFFGTTAPSRFYSAAPGQQLQFKVQAYSPASGSETAAAQTGLTYSTGALPDGASFDAVARVFNWTPTQAGVYQVQFRVSDGVLPESKTVTITVGIPNLPVANPGPSRTARLGSMVTLDGSGSQDAASTAPQLPAWWTLSFAWTQTAGPAVTLGSGGATAMTPTFVPPMGGRYTFQLVVNDGPVFSAPAPVTITVPILGHGRRGGRPGRKS